MKLYSRSQTLIKLSLRPFESQLKHLLAINLLQ